MSQVVTVKSAFQSTFPDTGDTTKFGPTAQNASRVFTGGSDGEIVARDNASATGASWVSGFFAGQPGANNYAPLILTGLYPGIDLYSTRYAATTMQARYQIVNGVQSVLEFNYWSGGGTTVQTGWSMDPNTQEFKSVGNVRGKYLTADSGSFLTGPTSILENELQAGVIRPTQLAANTNNWNPTGLATARLIFATTDASRNLTGLVGQSSGTRLTLLNSGTQNLVLVHQSGLSTLGNKFECPQAANYTLTPSGSLDLWYDSAAACWRVFGVAPDNVAALTANTFTATQTIDKANLVVMSTDGVLLENPTAATNAVPVQISPRSSWLGHVWANGTTDETNAFFAENLPAATGGTPTATWRLGYSRNGGVATFPMTVNYLGAMTLLGALTAVGMNLTAGTALGLGAGGYFLDAAATGKFILENVAANAGVGFDVSTDAVLKIRTRAHSAYAQIDALGHSTGGVAGVTTFGPAAVASITVKGGIVTAIS